MDDFAEEPNQGSSSFIRSEVFAQLNPLCTETLELLQKPHSNGAPLFALIDYVRNAPPDSLQSCFDYVLFPLLLLLDAAIRCRSSSKGDPNKNIGVDMAPCTISDRVAEGVLQCLEQVLKKCHLVSVNQMVVVLKSLTNGALLPPSDSSEEFREGIIKCLKALLLGLRPCFIKTCTCKSTPGLPLLVSNTELKAYFDRHMKFQTEGEECLISFLQSQDASAAVGHWLSLLLQAAETEAVRGHVGSAKLRVEAFLTLRILIAKVGTADALAFFLPGVVSGFGKVLNRSKIMISGAGGSVESIDHAVRGLAEFLMIVFGDEPNLNGLGISMNVLKELRPCKDTSVESVLAALRSLHPQTDNLNSVNMAKEIESRKSTADALQHMAPLHVHRSKEWIEKTAEHIDTLVSATFPHLCVHPAQKVRLGLVDAMQGLLTRCLYTLEKTKFILLECLFVLVCDDYDVVASAARNFLAFLFSMNERYLKENDIAEILSRLIEKLPRAVLGSDISGAVSHAQRLLAAIFFVGPKRVVDHILHTPFSIARLLESLAMSVSHNSAFASSMDELILAKPSAGYLHSISELKADYSWTNANKALMIVSSDEISKSFNSLKKGSEVPLEVACAEHLLPRMPPWFVHVGGPRLYHTLAGIVRLVSLSVMADCGCEMSLSTLTDVPLEDIHTLISELRIREYGKEGWQAWYARHGSGQLLRKASTAVCLLNEIIYGISDESVNLYKNLFRISENKVSERWEEEIGYSDNLADGSGKGIHSTVIDPSVNWMICEGGETRRHKIDCVGSILHEYLSPEIWDLPLDQDSPLLVWGAGAEDLDLHFFQDAAMLQQVIVDGLGIFGISLGKDFERSGFLHSSLYLLLKNLICSNDQVKSASDVVLQTLSSSTGHTTVKSLVVGNADYVVDSLCQQLRHVDLNPHVPDVLASMLSYIGMAHEILPLLEEPMRSISSELEVIGRHQHPELTIPFLKAIREIGKAAMHESVLVANESQEYFVHVKSDIKGLDKRTSEVTIQNDGSPDADGSGPETLSSQESMDMKSSIDAEVEHWEDLLSKLNDFRRYRRSVGSVAGSCISAATPLLASTEEASCLIALDVIELGVAALAKVEEAFRHERETKEAIIQVIQRSSFYDLQDTVDATNEGEADENRLLPAVNKIWPYLVLCAKHKNPVVIKRCLLVVSSVVQTCGGDFFIRRFFTDGSAFWNLLISAPFSPKPKRKNEGPIMLPYRKPTSLSPEHDSMAEISSLKVKESILKMITDISKNKKSARALEGVFRKVSSLIVGVACSNVATLRGTAIDALRRLSGIDPDFVWLLLADIVYSLEQKDEHPSPPSPDLAEVSQLLPPPSSAKEYLYVQYGGERFSVDVELSRAKEVFQKLNQESPALYMYING
ncbi:uncharacterized protein LOC18443063 isoform X1 [Amborella trichopoda]|uniref:Uncharacterized protein n=2 Tax=Amborella trichopoda TaxID=13333 RepID=U5D352_AMBTC|nr:uncharacterized protein LOC18443063 isoform X1 [Amborella trichopoda]ERN14793.1 hypothetical protein AMTR_s00032p00063530 [Amborella trichopoda]|eukprot:XP_006853326.1 uncharacterized protein LOC18443063 isoform X1 [Amborella trichopoda]